MLKLGLIAIVVSQVLQAAGESWLTLEAKFQKLNSKKTTQRICRQSDLIRKYKNRSSNSLAKTQLQNSVMATQNAIAVLNSTRSLRVDEGARNLEFILRYQKEIFVQNQSLLINVWVDQNKYYDQLNDNNLNSRAFGAGNQPSRVTDRDNTIDEIGTILSDIIVPESIAAFGPVRPVSNSLSDGFNVLIYDINDNFNFSGSFIGGYFDPDDKFSPNNNRMNAIHMDMYPSNPGGNNINISTFIPALPRKDFYQVLAHEFQHLIHSQFDLGETIWVNEGFSQYAIYRTLYNKKFSDGSALLNAPSQGPSQVSFWLENPSSSQLISSDEFGITGKLFQRMDSAELRGIGYLFFTYLWEQLGGNVNGGSLSGASADQRVNQMIQSPLNGIASIQAGLDGLAVNFNDLFNSFTVALNADGINSLYNMEFFDYSSNNQLFIANTVTANPDLVPLSFSLAGYDFRVINLNGGSKNATLRLDSSANFHAYLLEGVAPQSRNLVQDLVGQSNSLFVAAGSKNVLVISNPSLNEASVQLSYLTTMTLATESASSVTVVSQNAQITPISVSAFEIVSQRFTNNSTFDLDILSDKADSIAISACATGENCRINASYLKVSDSPNRRLSTVRIDNTDYFFSNLSLKAGQAYDLFYANKTNTAIQLSPFVTKTAVVISNSAPLPETDLGFPLSAGSASGGAGGCFLASASFLGKGSSEVLMLSEFRDQILLKFDWGKGLVQFYYSYSPQLANWISHRPLIGLLGQFILMPLVLVVGLIYHFHWILILLLLLPVALPSHKES